MVRVQMMQGILPRNDALMSKKTGDGDRDV